jgi:hypothetical protein
MWNPLDSIATTATGIAAGISDFFYYILFFGMFILVQFFIFGQIFLLYRGIRWVKRIADANGIIPEEMPEKEGRIDVYHVPK